MSYTAETTNNAEANNGNPPDSRLACGDVKNHTCEQCGTSVRLDGEFYECITCGHTNLGDYNCDAYYEEEPECDDGLSDVEADGMTLRDAGWGTDEDYGYYGGDDFGGE